MANANINLPYGVTKQVRVFGQNAANTAERPISNITFTVSNVNVAVIVTGDPQVFSVTNNSQTVNATGTIFWTAKNELNNTITGQTPFTMVAADPATTIATAEL